MKVLIGLILASLFVCLQAQTLVQINADTYQKLNADCKTSSGTTNCDLYSSLKATGTTINNGDSLEIEAGASPIYAYVDNSVQLGTLMLDDLQAGTTSVFLIRTGDSISIPTLSVGSGDTIEVAGTLSSSSLTIKTGGDVTVDNKATLTILGSSSISGSITLVGGSFWNIEGAVTASTSINSGANTTIFSTGSLTITTAGTTYTQSSGYLNITTGSITGNVNIGTAGITAESGTINGNLDFTSSSVFGFAFLKSDGSAWTTVSVGGIVTRGGKVIVVSIPVGGMYKFITSTGSGTESGTFASVSGPDLADYALSYTTTTTTLTISSATVVALSNLLFIVVVCVVVALM